MGRHGSLVFNDFVHTVPEGGINEAVDDRQQQIGQALADAQGDAAPAPVLAA